MNTLSRSIMGWGVLLGLGAATGCAFSHGPAADTAVVQVAQEPETLDPYLSPMGSVTSLSALCYSGLVSLDDHGNWVPDLAERVPTLANGDVRIDAHGMAVTYRLRPKATWHDGRPVTAADVQATWRLVMHPRFPSLSRSGYEEIRAVEAPDARTVVVRYASPYAPYLELFPYVLPAHVITPSLAHGQDPSREPWNRMPIGSGPYRIERWNSGDRLVAVRHPGYFRGVPSIPRIEVRFVDQENTAFNLWRTGEIDLLQGAPPTQFEALQREDAARLHLTPGSTWEHLVFNMRGPITGERAVREALARLVDRRRLNAAAYGDVNQPAWSEVPTFSWAYDAKLENTHPPDTEAAKRLLDATGWKPGPDGVRVKNGRRLALTLLTTSDKQSRALASQILRKQWSDAGIEVTIDRQAASVVFGSAASGGRFATGRYDVALVASTSRPDPDSSFRWRSDQVPPHGQNRSRYVNAEVDRLLLEGQRTVDPAKRRGLYHKLAERLNTDLPVLPLLYWVEIDATSARLEGVKPNPTLRGNLWNVWEWKLKSPS